MWGPIMSWSGTPTITWTVTNTIWILIAICRPVSALASGSTLSLSPLPELSGAYGCFRAPSPLTLARARGMTFLPRRMNCLSKNVVYNVNMKNIRANKDRAHPLGALHVFVMVNTRNSSITTTCNQNTTGTTGSRLCETRLFSSRCSRLCLARPALLL